MQIIVAGNHGHGRRVATAIEQCAFGTNRFICSRDKSSRKSNVHSRGHDLDSEGHARIQVAQGGQNTKGYRGHTAHKHDAPQKEDGVVKSVDSYTQINNYWPPFSKNKGCRHQNYSSTASAKKWQHTCRKKLADRRMIMETAGKKYVHFRK